MPIVAHIVCDGCQAVKKETNHWYSISHENNGLCITPLSLAPDWASKTLPDSSIEYYCGRFCAVEALTRWMNKLSDESALFPINGRDAATARAVSAEGSEEARSALPDRDIRSMLQGSRSTSLLES
jgi:hypothetical protein